MTIVEFCFQLDCYRRYDLCGRCYSETVIIIFRKGNTLYSKRPIGMVIKIIPEAKNQFSGTSREINSFKLPARREKWGNPLIFPFCQETVKKD